MIAKVIDFFRSKSGVLLAGALAILTALAAVFARGKRAGVLEQKVAQEEKEDQVEAEIRAGELAEAEARRKRAEQLELDMIKIEEAAEVQHAHPPATLDGARAEQDVSRARLLRLKK